MSLMTIYFIWLGSVLPQQYKDKIKECKTNYGDCRLIGQQEESYLVKKYNKYHPNNTIIQRADVLRLLVLQEYGGIYLDFDTQINDWDYLKILNCEGKTFFCEEQIALLNEEIYKVSNWFACSGKNTSQMQRLIDNIQKVDKGNPTPIQVLEYAGPGYLLRMNAKYMITYPNIKHCYDNNWTVKREGCVTPLYHLTLYFGYKCFYLMGAVYFIFILLYCSIRHFYKKQQQSSSSQPYAINSSAVAHDQAEQSLINQSLENDKQ